MDYKKINNYLGWLVFIIATAVYFITLEDTVSLWDCGEYITAAYKLEVGHPPGAPFFMVLGRLASFFADPEHVAVWINRLSALSSSATILFMFWSITLLVKKIALKTKRELETGDKIAIFGSALIGSLAYTFSESFWFSAVEGEVYAMSSLFTAIIFWAILKWDEEMMEIKYGKLVPAQYSPDRWLLFIMFMLGLAIGVHLLGILVVPAITFIIYFRYGKEVDFKGVFLVGILSLFILVFIQEGVIPGSIAMASAFEVSFVNGMGMPFYTGAIFFFAVLIGLFLFLLRYSRKKKYRILYSSVMGLILLFIGYGSFAVIVIRSNANTPLDENDPENLVTLHSYLKREQYGSAPILFGPFWNSKENGGKLEVKADGSRQWIAHADKSQWKDHSAVYLRRFVVTKNDTDIKAFTDEKMANDYAKEVKGATVEEKYFESNAESRKQAEPTYAQTTFFPRMYWSQDQTKVAMYKEWSGYDPYEDKGTEKGKLERNPRFNPAQKEGPGNRRMLEFRLPTFGENFTFFRRYQVNWMYFRYFFWNFAGRQNDIQGHGDAMRGNWISGFSMVDDARLGDQSAAPYFTKDNPSNNKFFFIPLILGLIGLFFHVYKTPKDAFVLFLAFLMTGLAIVIYLNQKPFEPRERDYAYAGSFYFFAMWIGIGVYALYEAFKSFGKNEFKRAGIVSGLILLLFLLVDVTSAEVSMPATLSWLIISAIGFGAVGLMVALRKVLSENKQGAIIASLIAFAAPLIMGLQGWDDHDRSLKTSAHDLAYNYLSSCGPNGIIFTNGDNDTFPLWYMQEVEGKFTDRRVCNLSLMQTDWYTNQMKMKAYGSDPLPIKFREDQILMNSGATDQVLFSDVFNLMYNGADQKVLEKILELRIKTNPKAAEEAIQNFGNQVPALLYGIKSKNKQLEKRIKLLIKRIGTPAGNNLAKAAYAKYFSAYQIFDAIRSGMGSGMIELDQQNLSAFQKILFSFEDGWETTNLADAMEFIRNDDNMVGFSQGKQYLRVFPSSGFVFPVNEENVVASGMVTKDQLKDCVKEIRFKFDGGGLTREEVMMLDIIANNNWKRPLYFSSPQGSDVASALYYGWSGRVTDGHIKQNGMAFELTPLRGKSFTMNRERMYENLMKNYHYGEMQNPEVLTDYYTRRHTNQYRSHFYRLAKDYAVSAAQAEMYMDQGAVMEGQPTKEEIAEYKKRAIELIKKSLEVMPANVVIDYGEPHQNGQLRYRLGSEQLPSYADGVLHEYVDILFLAGDKEAANKLGMQVCDQLESIFNYYDKGNAAVVTEERTMYDFYAALEAYFVLFEAAADPAVGDPEGELAKRIAAKLKEMYSTVIPSMQDELEELANKNGETIREGSSGAGLYAKRLFKLQDYTFAMAIHHQFIEDPAKKEPVAPQGATPAGMMPSGNQAPPTGSPEE